MPDYSVDHIGWDHDIAIARPRVAPANLLLASGHVHFTEMTDHEGSGNVDFRLALHNPDPTRTVTITRARFIPASPGGWITQTPSPMTHPAFASILAPIAPLSTATADVSGWWFAFNAHLFFAFRAVTSDGYYQDLLVQLPVTITPSTTTALFAPGTSPPLPTAAPGIVQIEAPILLTLHEPVEAFLVDRGSKSWIPLTGQVVNCTDEDIVVERIHYALEGISSTGEATTLEDDIGSPAFDSALDDPGRRIFTFNHSIAVEPDGTEWRTVTLELHFRNPGLLYIRPSPPRPVSPVVRRVTLQPNIRTDLSCPLGRVAGAVWVNWNSTQREGLNGHLYSQSNRYALDIVLTVDGSTLRPGSAADENESFYAYDQPILAMADGTIVFINDAFTENNGNTNAGGTGINALVIQYGPNLYAVYAHIKQGSVAALGLVAGQPVTRGQEIARLGNGASPGGSSEPHLHLSYWLFDPITGVHRTIPLHFRNLEDGDGNQLPGVIVNGTAFQQRRQPSPKPVPKTRLPKRKIAVRPKRPRR